ncbi:MAG: hypothetical protein EA427_17340 [Spirochaetaceae bacterium]|nr:MAG: hypothetical protein EA427_17340 [Spirochaetaceae bacterium]
MAHIDYHVVLETLREHRDCCPLCAFVARSENSWFESMLYSWVGTEGFQDRFLSSDGFCPAHAHRFAERNDGVAVAMLYLPLLNHRRRWLTRSMASFPLLRRLRPLLKGRDRSPAGRGERALSGSCLLCDQIAHWETQFLRNMVRHGGEEALRDSFTAGQGLCLPHYRLLAGKIGRVPPWVREHQENRISSLEEAVELYTRGAAGGVGGRASTVWKELLEFMEGPAGAIRKRG